MVASSSDLSLCALVPYPPNIAPSQRYRLEQWLPSLNEQGIRVDLLPFVDAEMMQHLHQPTSVMMKSGHFFKAFARRCAAIAQACHYDAVLVHRAACIAGPAWVERFIPLFNCPIIYDFDDAIFQLHTTAANRFFGWLKFPGKTSSICRLSSHVVVGNKYLGEYASRYNKNVTVIPSSVDTDSYLPLYQEKQSDRLVVGWTGSSTSQTYLEDFAPVLQELIKHRDVAIHVISDRKPDMPGVPVDWRPWSPETEIADLAQFDIGIMPMPDDQWSRGKCSMKALLYMAMGIPTICSAVGMNREVIEHGENGLLAETKDEWLGCLHSLIDNAALRQRLGAAGRKTIEDRYSMRHCAAQFANVIREVVARQNANREVRKWFLLKSKSNEQ